MSAIETAVSRHLDIDTLKREAKRLLGDQVAQLLADHDAALLHHTSEINRVDTNLASILSQFVAHASEMERRLHALETTLAVQGTT